MARAYRFWTPDDEATARAMRAEGSTYAEIATALDRSAHAVEQALLRMSGGFHRMGRTCSECPTPISDKNKGGRCKRCNLRSQNADREFNRRRLASLLNHPSMRAGSPERKLGARRAAAKRMANPQYREWLVAFMRDVVSPKSRTPEVLAKKDMKAAGRKLSARLLAWCPEEYRDAYRAIRRKGVPVAEAKAAILAQHKADLARLSPFERQMRALERGAQLVANDIRPSLANPGYYEERRWTA